MTNANKDIYCSILFITTLLKKTRVHSVLTSTPLSAKSLSMLHYKTLQNPLSNSSSTPQPVPTTEEEHKGVEITEIVEEKAEAEAEADKAVVDPADDPPLQSEGGDDKPGEKR